MIDGVDSEIARGCGGEFQLDSAIPYQIDETIIDAQKKVINEIREKLQYYEQCSSLWNRAKSLPTPPLVAVRMKSQTDNSIYPSVELTTEGSSNTNQNRCIHCIQVLWEYRTLAPLVMILPDLIEVGLLPL